VIYLDTSAFIKLYFLEEGSEFVQGRVTRQDEPLPVWDLLQAEMINACRLKVFWGDLTEKQADEQIRLFAQRLQKGQYHVPEIDRGALMKAFRMLARHTPRLGCRTMDILHVACALQWSVDEFVSYDDRQRSLAVQAGLQVQPAS
jgi:predicted nucleic acid-binding protein